MYRWIYLAVLTLFHISQAVLGADRVLEITGVPNPDIPVWTHDRVEIIATNTLISKWSLNNTIIAELDPIQPYYNYPNTSLPINITADPGTGDSSLILPNVSRIYTGIYEADGNSGIFSLTMIVHEINLSSAEFNLTDDSGLCTAYLSINDFVDPSSFEIFRIVNSSDLIFPFENPSNTTSFEIVNSSLNIINNVTNVEISVQYTFTYNNFSTVEFKNISFNSSLIRSPRITPDGTPGNCTILIQHNTDVKCVHDIIYCLNINDTEVECNVSSNLDALILKFPENSTSANLSIVYDIIYAKYPFNIDIIQCTAEVITSVEPTTLISSPPELTTAQSGTSDDTTTSEDMTNHSDSIYSSMSPSLFSTDLDTVTVLLTTASSELPNITLSPTMNITAPPANPGSLAGWIIAVIVVGSVLAVILLGAGIGLVFKKIKSIETFGNGSFRTTKIKPKDPDIPLEVQPSSKEYIVRKSIPSPETTNQRQMQHDRQRPPAIRTLSTSPERTERQQRRYERRQPPSSSHDQMIRPTIPQPTSKSYDPSDRQEVRRNRRQAHPTNYEPFTQPSASRPMSTSPDLVYQQELSRDRQRPLPLTSNV